MAHVENGTEELEVVVKLRCSHRSGQQRSFSYFKFSDCIADVTTERDGKEIHAGTVGGVVGADVQVVTDEDSGLPGAGETWMLTAEELWNAFHVAREKLGELPPLIQGEWPKSRCRLQIPMEEILK